MFDFYESYLHIKSWCNPPTIFTPYTKTNYMKYIKYKPLWMDENTFYHKYLINQFFNEIPHLTNIYIDNNLIYIETPNFKGRVKLIYGNNCNNKYLFFNNCSSIMDNWIVDANFDGNSFTKKSVGEITTFCKSCNDKKHFVDLLKKRNHIEKLFKYNLGEITFNDETIYITVKMINHL